MDVLVQWRIFNCSNPTFSLQLFYPIRPKHQILILIFRLIALNIIFWALTNLLLSWFEFFLYSVLILHHIRAKTLKTKCLHRYNVNNLVPFVYIGNWAWLSSILKQYLKFWLNLTVIYCRHQLITLFLWSCFLHFALLVILSIQVNSQLWLAPINNLI